jgi:hypothetical protein
LNGVDLADQTLIDNGHVRKNSVANGAYLWKTSDKRDNPESDAVKPQNVTEAANFVMITNNDQVKIIGGNQEYYHIEIVSNAADKNNSSVVGQKGWVLRRIVDGP